MGFLTREEVQAVLDAPNLRSWSGRRDRALFVTLYNTGARVSQVVGVARKDLELHRSAASLTLHGKSRKERSVPLWRTDCSGTEAVDR